MFYFFRCTYLNSGLTWLFQDEDDKNLVREYKWDPSETLGQHTFNSFWMVLLCADAPFSKVAHLGRVETTCAR